MSNIVFATCITKEIMRFSLPINIEETLFSRSTKWDYSLVEKGKKCTVRNIWFSNSVSLIAVITSAGFAYVATSDDTVNGYRIRRCLVPPKLPMFSKIREGRLDNGDIYFSKI